MIIAFVSFLTAAAASFVLGINARHPSKLAAVCRFVFAVSLGTAGGIGVELLLS